MNKKILIIPGITLLLAVTAYFIVGYYIYNMMTATHPKCESVYMDGRRDFTPSYFEGEYDYPEINIDVTPYLMESYENVSFPARGGGANISGWFVPASAPSERVVVVVHGGDVCKRNTSVLLPAGMLANNGFNVLLIDLRNHGDSEITGERFTAGVEEYKDVQGAYDWLLSQGYAPESVGLMGVSMGAATALNAFGEEENIAAIWADSSFSDIPTVLDDQLEMNSLPKFMKNAVLTISKLDGYNLNGISPMTSIRKNANRPVMITHGTQDEWVSVSSAYSLQEAVGENVQLWIVEDMRHVEAMFIFPEEYSQRMVMFFDEALGK